MKFKLLILSLFIATLAFGQNKNTDQTNITLKQKIDYFSKITDTLLYKGKTPGVAIAIIYDNELMYKETFGYRDLENKLPVTNNTIFEIGSLTKAFTGVIASKLVDEKIINWDDKVIKHLPEFKLHDTYATQNATIKDLLTHRVGLEQHFYLMYGPKFSRNEIFEKLPYLNFKGSFRENFVYNNFMYTVAGIIQERVTQKSWEDLIDENIFKPLGMNNSFTDFEEFTNYANKTVSYQNDGATIIPEFGIDTYAPAGSITSTIDDMAIWAKMLANSGTLNRKEFLSKKQFDYLTSPLSIRYSSEKIAYGIGWDIDTKQNIIYHDGSSAGQRSRIMIQPEKGFGIVILTNQDAPLSNMLGIYACRIFLDNDFSRLLNLEDIIESGAKSNKIIADTYSIDDNSVLKQLKNIDGMYTHPAYGTIEINKIERNKYSFKYYDFKGTIKHNQALEFTAFLNHFKGPDAFDFKILKDENNIINGIEVRIPYSEPLNFIKTNVNTEL